MDFSWLYEMPLFTVILPFLLVILLLAMEAGLWLGSRQNRSASDVGQAAKTDVTLAAMLTLLGLMLAFTYSFSMSRADLRKQALVTEVNALSTAFLRAELAPDPEGLELRQRLLDYTHTRLVSRLELNSLEQLRRVTELSLQSQARIWPAAKAVIARQDGMPGPQESLLIQAINDVLDAHTSRMAVINDRLPGIVMLLLLLIATACMLVAAYNAAMSDHPSRWRLNAFVVILTALMYVIVDFDFSLHGFIVIDHEGLEVLAREMEAAMSQSRAVGH